MSAFLRLTVLSILLPLALTRLFCGLDPFTNNFMELFVKLDCNHTLLEHVDCCKDHGKCYAHRKASMEKCDNEYCACVSELAKEGVCKNHADNFCNTVKSFGKVVWPSFSDNNMIV
ncbi:unnamed protein product [Caenorhabditis auriculariae]|uniref:Uncharacterized protein n=1 Tax=Caenorhabditis auriculariae TaxID=2777116 RepID=A0A8S1HW78_9PELO|nr:unnamed protein product [Caenorhabditis auriculariae]